LGRCWWVYAPVDNAAVVVELNTPAPLFLNSCYD
jgi:hypothetical protein